MMDNLLQCWSFCLKRCPCCGGNRIGPSSSVGRIVVTPPKTSSIGCCSRPKTRTAPAQLLSGETNLYFQGDEVTFGGVNSSPIQRNGRCTESPEEIGETLATEDGSTKSVDNYVYEEFLSTLYIETGHGKQLRVMHIIPPANANPEKDSGSIGQKSMSIVHSSETVDDSEGDSDEEYWFTRWSRRPRLKNSFKGSVGFSIGKDDTLQSPCIELRIAKEIEKFQSRNQAKTNEDSGILTPTHVPVSPRNPGKTRQGSSSSNTESNHAVSSVSSSSRNGSTNSFTNFGFQPEEISTEIKTDNEIPENRNKSPEVANSIHCATSLDGDTKGKTEPLLLFFIHGISGSSDIWKSQFDFFHSVGFEIVAPDLLGHGLSSTPKKSQFYLFESLVQDLVKVFDHFAKDNRRGVLIGHGYGACLATVLSRVRPNNVCLLVSISGGGPTAMTPPAAFRKPFLPFDFNLFAKREITARFDNPDFQHVLPSYVRRRIFDGQVWVDGDTAFHRRISVPTLLIYGMRDKVVSLIEECEMERTIPRAFLELIPTAGHMAMWDEPKKLNRMILKFIQSWPH